MAEGERHSVATTSLWEDDLQPPPPLAWQPFTPSGIAAFKSARYGRVLLVSSLVAVFIGVLVCWFVHQTFRPALEEAIRSLPDEGAIQDRKLVITSEASAVLAEERVLGIVVDLDGGEYASLSSDFQVILQREGLRVCSQLGCLWAEYPAGWRIEVNRKVWEPGMEAWQPMIYGLLFFAVVGCLLICWHVLATLYSFFPWLASYCSDRRMTAGECWRLSMASLMPGALLMAGAILFYGLGWADLVRFTMMGALHIVLPWAYLAMSFRSMPKSNGPLTGHRNPFGPLPPAEPERARGIGNTVTVIPPPRSKNPFADQASFYSFSKCP